MRSSTFLSLVTAVLLLAACAENAPTVNTDGVKLLADAGYYPTLPACVWDYRVDSIRGGVTQKGVAMVRSTTEGLFANDSVEYRVQVNQVSSGTTVEYDTVYVRKASEGVRLSSPGLQSLSGLPSLPGLSIGEIPRDFLVVPYTSFLGTWDILNIEYNPIPLIIIYFRVKGRNLGSGDAVTELRTFRSCAHVQLIIEAQFPDPQNPMDFLNPIRLNEVADFYFTQPQGLVLAEGSAAVFRMLRGDIPLDRNYPRVRQEVTAMSIVQPDPLCVK
jgi:hypothetical protein